MKLVTVKVWSLWDIALLKWSALVFGAVIGAHFPDFIMEYLVIFLLAAVALAIRPAITHFRGND